MSVHLSQPLYLKFWPFSPIFVIYCSYSLVLNNGAPISGAMNLQKQYPVERVIAIDGGSWISMSLKCNILKKCRYKPIILAMKVHELPCPNLKYCRQHKLQKQFKNVMKNHQNYHQVHVIKCHEMSFNLTWWHFMTYDDIWWNFMIYDIWWHFMTKHVVYHDISWHVMTNHEMTRSVSERN